MQSWQIKVLKLEESVLDDLNGFVHEHALYFLLGVIGLLAILLAWVLSGGLRRRFPQQAGRVQPVIVIESLAPPPPAAEPFDPFPSIRECDCERHDDWED